MNDDRRSGSRRSLVNSPWHRKRRICAFCVEKVNYIDYKDHDVLRRYLTEHGRLRPRRQTGTCAKHQRALAKAVKRARHLALIPFVVD